MADLEKTVQIIFSGADNVSQTMAKITGNVDKFAGGVQKATQPLADLTSGVLKTEAALGALAVGGLALAYKKAIEFEGSQIELAKVLGDEIGALDEASDYAMELSNAYGVSATNVLGSAASFKQAGFDIEGALKLTKNALDLVIAGDLDASEASEILIATLKGFNAPASEATHLIDILNEVSNQYATDTEQLGRGMAALSPIARQMGFSFEETAAILTPVIEVFRSGDESANALKTGLLKLVQDSKPVQDALESIGISQRDANGELKSGKEILFEVATKFTTLSDNQKSFLAQQLVGINQSARMVTVFDNLSKVTDITAVAMNSAGSAAKEVEARLASGEVAVDRFTTGFTNASIAVGERFRDSATGAINGATEIENTIQKLAQSGAFDDLLSVVSNMADDIGTWLSDVAEAMPEAFEKIDWSRFTQSLENVIGSVGDLFDAFFGDLDLTNSDDLAKAIEKIANSGAFLNDVVAGILDAWKPFARAVGEAIDTFAESGEGAGELAGNILGIGTAINKIAGAVSSLTGALTVIAGSQAVNTIINIGKAAVSASPGVAALATTVGGVTKTLGAVGLAGAAGYAAGTLINEYVPGVKSSADAITDWIFKQSEHYEKLEEADERYREAAARAKEVRDALKAMGEVDPDISADTSIFEKKMAMVQRVVEEFEYNQAMKEVVIDNRDALKILDETEQKAREAGERIGQALSAGMDDGAFEGIEDFIPQIEDELEKVGVKTEADQDAIDKTKKKIKREFTNASVGIDVSVNAGDGGAAMGGIFGDEFNQAAKPKIEDIFSNLDPGGLADLIDKINDIENPFEAAKATELLFDQMKQGNNLLQAYESLVRSQNAVAQQMWRSAEVYDRISGTRDNTIEIEAHGLEPEMEAFMWKLLKKIQVRANESGAEFLLAASGE